MKPEDYVDVAATIKRAARSPKPYFWFFCAKGEDGKPALLVGKREGEIKVQGKEIRKSAKDKKGGRGRLIVDADGKLVFGLEDGNAPLREVEKSIKLKIAKEDGLKPVKGLLLKARVVDGEEIEDLVTGEDESEASDAAEKATKVQTKLDAARARAKTAWDAAVKRVGADHADLKALAKLQEKAKSARTAGVAALQSGNADVALDKLEAALDLYDELGDGAASAGADDRADEEEADEVEDEVDEEDDDRAVKDADPAKLLAMFRDAMDDANTQIGKLRQALLAAEDEELADIAELGLPALTGNYRVPLQSALMDATRCAPSDRPAALKKVRAAATSFLDHVSGEEMFEVCDDNPFGVKVTLRKTLGSALRRILSSL